MGEPPRLKNSRFCSFAWLRNAYSSVIRGTIFCNHRRKVQTRLTQSTRFKRWYTHVEQKVYNTRDVRSIREGKPLWFWSWKLPVHASPSKSCYTIEPTGVFSGRSFRDAMPVRQTSLSAGNGISLIFNVTHERMRNARQESKRWTQILKVECLARLFIKFASL